MDYLKYGVNDPRLKPRLLRSLLRDWLPDEKRPFPKPRQLSFVLSQVKTHGLLSESLPDASDKKLADAWRSAVDAWVERILALVSSDMPDKCWAGICLLGVTCEECSISRFEISYSDWFQKLLAQIQSPPDSRFIKAAACASFSDILSRLAGASTTKKDTITSLSSKLVHPILQLLSEDATDDEWEGAVDLLCVIMTFSPTSILRNYDKVEVKIASKIMSGKCDSNLSKKLARCLSLLPKTKGDVESWSLMLKKILIAINELLNGAFLGLEGKKSFDFLRLLVPSGQELPPPLGGYLVSEESSEHIARRLQELLVPRVSTLMQCCYIMLVDIYPDQMTVLALLEVVRRVLLTDGSLHDSFSPFTSALHQELLCSELPTLHICSLDLLCVVMNGVRSLLLPHAANVMRLLTDYLKRATLPCIRIKVYSIIQSLIISKGAGMVEYRAQEVISNVFSDLGSVSHEGVQRKRKQPEESPLKQHNGYNIDETAVWSMLPAPLSVQIAALRALEALLTVGGSMRKFECWHSDIDYRVITAVNVFHNVKEEQSFTDIGKLAPTRADFQLAALKVLLVSLLSQTHVRPPYLSEALELFSRGKRETWTKLGEFCCHAMMALEVLIHPRVAPLAELPAYPPERFDQLLPDIPYVGNSSAVRALPGNYLQQNGLEVLSPILPHNTVGLNHDHDGDVVMVSECKDGEAALLAGRDTTASQPAVSESNDGIKIKNFSSSNDEPEMTKTSKDQNIDSEMNRAGDSDMVSPSVAAVIEEASSNANHGEAIPSETQQDLKEVVESIENFTDSVTRRNEMSYDSDSSSSESLPPIVFNDPDSD